MNWQVEQALGAAKGAAVSLLFRSGAVVEGTLVSLDPAGGDTVTVVEQTQVEGNVYGAPVTRLMTTTHTLDVTTLIGVGRVEVDDG